MCALEAGLDRPAAVVQALAVASASCEQPVAGAVDVSRAEELETGMHPRPVDPPRRRAGDLEARPA